MSDKLRTTIELVGIIGLITSVALLAHEINQNTKATRGATVHEVSRDFADRYQLPPHILDIVDRRLRGDAVSNIELAAEDRYVSVALRMFENLWYQHSLGVLDDELFKGYSSTLRVVFNNPLYSDSYVERFEAMKKGDALHPGFVQFAERFLPVGEHHGA